MAATHTGVGRKFLSGSGFAYAWFANQCHHLPVTSQCLFESSFELVHLALTADEDTSGHRVERALLLFVGLGGLSEVDRVECLYQRLGALGALSRVFRQEPHDEGVERLG